MTGPKGKSVTHKMYHFSWLYDLRQTGIWAMSSGRTSFILKGKYNFYIPPTSLIQKR